MSDGSNCTHYELSPGEDFDANGVAYLINYIPWFPWLCHQTSHFKPPMPLCPPSSAVNHMPLFPWLQQLCLPIVRHC
jgi:hypothetical protein